MAAPSGTKWGNIITGSKSTRKGQIGIYAVLDTSKSTSTTAYVNVEVWFATMYSLTDTNNTYYYDEGKTAATTSRGSVNLDHDVNTGSGWSTSNQTKLGSYTHSYSKTTSSQTKYFAAKITGIDNYGASSVSSVYTSVNIPAKPSYKITYNANGGTGAPSVQTKWYGTALTLSTIKPTKTGHSFSKWNTASGGTGTSYNPGGSYTANASATLYAQWTANTYAVKFDANGGTGAPANQTKTYGTTLTLSSTKPTRTNYNFKGWGTSANATIVAYNAGGSYTTNAAITLYAIWELAYTKPRITSFSIDRCDWVEGSIPTISPPTLTDEGRYGLVKFEYAIDRDLVSVLIQWKLSTDSEYSSDNQYKITTPGVTSINAIIGENDLDPDCTYDVCVTVTDTVDHTTKYAVLPGTKFIIDLLGTGDGISFGKPAELPGVADFAYQVRLGGGLLQSVLPDGTDLDTMIIPNTYAGNAATTAGYLNCPITSATSFTFEVISAGSEGQLMHRITTCSKGTTVVYVRHYYLDAWGDWYEIGGLKSAITVRLSDSVALGTVNVYTPIPFNATMTKINNKLTLSGGSVTVGSGVRYVKVSGQVKIHCGTTGGNRHARIQKTSGTTTSYPAWQHLNLSGSGVGALHFTTALMEVAEGDKIDIVVYSPDSTDSIYAGTSNNGPQTYLTVEAL